MIFYKKYTILIFGLLLLIMPTKASAIDYNLCEAKMADNSYTPPYIEWTCYPVGGVSSAFTCGPVVYSEAACNAELAKKPPKPSKTPPAFKASVGFCLCDTKCQDWGYKTQKELDDAKAYCASAACTKVPRPFYENDKCKLFIGHCECKSGCVPKTYSNLDELKAGNEFCASAPCSATDKVFKDGGCTPAAETGSTAPVDKGPTEVKLENPLALGPAGNATDVPTIIGTIINGIMGIMGAIVLLMVVYGGTTWLMSAGNPEKVKAGSQTIFWALLGAVITVASYLILNKLMELITTNVY